VFKTMVLDVKVLMRARAAKKSNPSCATPTLGVLSWTMLSSVLPPPPLPQRKPPVGHFFQVQSSTLTAMPTLLFQEHERQLCVARQATVVATRAVTAVALTGVPLQQRARRRLPPALL